MSSSILRIPDTYSFSPESSIDDLVESAIQELGGTSPQEKLAVRLILINAAYQVGAIVNSQKINESIFVARDRIATGREHPIEEYAKEALNRLAQSVPYNL